MSNIVFFTYGSTLELNGEQFEAGRLTEELLNLSPECYRPLHDRMERITDLEERYDREEDIAILLNACQNGTPFVGAFEAIDTHAVINVMSFPDYYIGWFIIRFFTLS